MGGTVRSFPVATGITARERLASSRSGKVVDAACGLALRRLSPSSFSAHWNNWEGADSSSMPDPVRKTSQRRVNKFHSSVETPMFTLGRSSFGPRGAGGIRGPVVWGNVYDGEGLGEVVGLEIARGDCAGDDYHGYFMKKRPSRCAKLFIANDEVTTPQ